MLHFIHHRWVLWWWTMRLEWSSPWRKLGKFAGHERFSSTQMLPRSYPSSYLFILLSKHLTGRRENSSRCELDEYWPDVNLGPQNLRTKGEFHLYLRFLKTLPPNNTVGNRELVLCMWGGGREWEWSQFRMVVVRCPLLISAKDYFLFASLSRKYAFPLRPPRKSNNITSLQPLFRTGTSPEGKRYSPTPGCHKATIQNKNYNRRQINTNGWKKLAHSRCKKPGTTASFLCREKSPTNYTANGHKIAHRTAKIHKSQKGAKCKQLTTQTT